MLEFIRDAIRGRKVLEVRYKNTTRIVEPYILYESKNGGMLLHGWQVDGEWEKSPPPDWCSLRVSEISSVMPTGDQYSHPHEGYNPASRQFYRVLYQA